MEKELSKALHNLSVSINCHVKTTSLNFNLFDTGRRIIITPKTTMPPLRTLPLTVFRLRSSPLPSVSTLSLRSTSTSSPSEPGWQGRTADQHTARHDDDANIHSSASKSGKQDRLHGDGHSQATTQKDHGNNNQRAKEDHPEAPGPVIGMNDERGGVGVFLPVELQGQWADFCAEGALARQ